MVAGTANLDRPPVDQQLAIPKVGLPEADTLLYTGEEARLFPAAPTRALHQVVPVDYAVHGCPIAIPEFLAVLKCVLSGIPYVVPDQAVCTECKRNENVCLYDRGVTCLGPVTRAGCNSWCVNNGNICYGCRGILSNPNEKGARDVFAKYAISEDLILNKMKMYNKCAELDVNE